MLKGIKKWWKEASFQEQNEVLIGAGILALIVSWVLCFGFGVFIGWLFFN